MKSQREDQLIKLSKSYESALAASDLSKVEDLLADNVTLHGDKVALLDDLHGKETVLKWHKAFFEKYQYKHEDLIGAVDENDNTTFSLSVDSGVTPKVDTQQPDDQKKPSSVIAITHLVWDGNDKISDIWKLRQLSIDEAHRKMKNIPDYHGSSFNPYNMKSTGDDIEPNPDRAHMHEEAAAKWNQIWTESNPSIADEILTDDVKVHNLLTSDETTGKEEFKGKLKGILGEWEPQHNEKRIAVTPGNKAFMFWTTTGTLKGDWSSVYGLEMLVFNKEGKVAEIASLYQPFPPQRKALLKAEE